MRSFTRRTVATVAATAMSAGLFLIAAPAMAATPAQATTSTVAAASDHDDYDYEDAEVVAVLEGAIKVRLDTGEIITLRVGPGCPILKGASWSTWTRSTSGWRSTSTSGSVSTSSASSRFTESPD